MKHSADVEKLYKAKLLENSMHDLTQLELEMDLEMGNESLQRNDDLNVMDSETLRKTARADLESGFELGRNLAGHLGEYGETFSPVEFAGVAEFFMQLATSLATEAETVLNAPQDNTPQVA